MDCPFSLNMVFEEHVKLAGILYRGKPRMLPVVLGLQNSLQNQESQTSARSRSGNLKAGHT